MAAKKKSVTKLDETTVPVIDNSGLAEIVAAGESGMYVSESVFKPLLEKGYVEINTFLTNANGEVATRATQKGIDSLNAPVVCVQEVPVENVSEPKKEKSVFKIDDNLPIPTITGRGRKGCSYPFDALQVGQSFFVPNDESKPNATKAMGSTVSSTNARYAVPSPDGATRTNKAGEVVPVMIETRKFVVRSVEENGIKGARIWRSQ
jgi:hypothetical protein